MEDINNYLQKVKKENIILDNTFFDRYKEFNNYSDKNIFKIDVEFLCSYIYDIKIDTTGKKDIRNGQQKFSLGLIDRYKNCMITGRSNIVCEACHIVPHSDQENYDLDNGLLLCKELHCLFDKDQLKINYETSTVELSDTVMNDCTLKDYHQYHLTKLNLNNNVKKYLKLRYLHSINF
jgi:hypothetical protein